MHKFETLRGAIQDGEFEKWCRGLLLIWRIRKGLLVGRSKMVKKKEKEERGRGKIERTLQIPATLTLANPQCLPIFSATEASYPSA